MLLKKEVLTTGQVAQLCNVAPRTVTKWFDAGRLRGYRIPGSRDRRIPVSDLIAFMKAHDIPTDGIEKGKLRLLIIDSRPDTARGLAAELEPQGQFETECAHNSFDAGLLVQKFSPSVILIDLMSNDINAQHLCDYVHSNPDLAHCRIIALAGGLGQTEAANLRRQGFSGVVTDAGNIPAILAAIEAIDSTAP